MTPRAASSALIYKPFPQNRIKTEWMGSAASPYSSPVYQSSQGAAASSANLLGLSVPDQGLSSALSDGAVVPDHALTTLQSAGPRVPDSRSSVPDITVDVVRSHVCYSSWEAHLPEGARATTKEDQGHRRPQRFSWDSSGISLR